MAKKNGFLIIVIFPLILSACPEVTNVNDDGNTDTYQDDNGETDTASTIADHSIVDVLRLGNLPESAVSTAKQNLHIGYGHTSHGSQITDGMSGLVGFANNGGLNTSYTENLFAFSSDGSGDSLYLFEGDGYGDGDLDHDAGYSPNWVNETRSFLNDEDNSHYNVIMWSWCGQVSSRTEQGMVDTYLTPMAQLEEDYPDVMFVYMTGHLDGTGEEGNLHQRNEQIRKWCADNNCWLFDFADIESYDPDGNYYLNKAADDACNYDSDGNGSRESNWATAWQNSHTEETDWYNCGSSHSQPLNANMKAYAVWWLFSRMAGWNG